VGSKHGIAHIIGRLIKDVDSPLADVEDALFSHFFARSPLVELVQYLGNGGAGMASALRTSSGSVAAMAKLLVTLFSQCRDGIDVGPGQIRDSVNIVLAGHVTRVLIVSGSIKGPLSS